MKTFNPMTGNFPFTDEQVERLGNTIIFFAKRFNHISKTKLLKLIYLIEEISIKKYGVPFFNIPFEVWRLGPVSREIYIELDLQPSYLNGYFTVHFKDNRTYIEAAKPFDNNEFSDNDLELLDLVCKKFENYSANELIELTHSPNSIWTKYARENNLIEAFDKKKTNSSTVEIDLSELLPADSIKKMLFQDYVEHFEASRSLKSL